MLHLTQSSWDWYAARAAGIVAYVLLSAVVVLGVTLAGRGLDKVRPRFAVEDVHRFGGLLVGTFLTIHVVTIAIDSYLPFTLGQIIVPFTSIYKPLWTGLGVVAAELLIALAITNRLRKTLSYRVWRTLHYVNFAVWAGATVHALGAGTDRSAPWMVATMAVSVGAVFAATTLRVLHKRAAWALGTALFLGLGAGAAVAAIANGPLKPAKAVPNALSFNDKLSGKIVRQTAVTRGIASVVGVGRGRQRVLVRADLLLAPAKLVDTQLQVEYLPSGMMCVGTVDSILGTGFTGTCKRADGLTAHLVAHWTAANSDPNSPLIVGTLASSPVGAAATSK